MWAGSTCSSEGIGVQVSADGAVCGLAVRMPGWGEGQPGGMSQRVAVKAALPCQRGVSSACPCRTRTAFPYILCLRPPPSSTHACRLALRLIASRHRQCGQRAPWSTRDLAEALVAALLFAVHPVHTEAVAGIVGHAEMLCASLSILALLSYMAAADGRCGAGKGRGIGGEELQFIPWWNDRVVVGGRCLSRDLQPSWRCIAPPHRLHGA